MKADIRNMNDHFRLETSSGEPIPTTSDAYNLSTLQDEAPGIDLRTSNYSAATGRPGSVYLDAMTGLEAGEENQIITDHLSKQVALGGFAKSDPNPLQLIKGGLGVNGGTSPVSANTQTSKHTMGQEVSNREST